MLSYLEINLLAFHQEVKHYIVDIFEDIDENAFLSIINSITTKSNFTQHPLFFYQHKLLNKSILCLAFQKEWILLVFYVKI